MAQATEVPKEEALAVETAPAAEATTTEVAKKELKSESPSEKK